MIYQASKQSINQASKKTDFTVDLIWWVGFAKARPNNISEVCVKCSNTVCGFCKHPVSIFTFFRI